MAIKTSDWTWSTQQVRTQITLFGTEGRCGHGTSSQEVRHQTNVLLDHKVATTRSAGDICGVTGHLMYAPPQTAHSSLLNYIKLINLWTRPWMLQENAFKKLALCTYYCPVKKCRNILLCFIVKSFVCDSKFNQIHIVRTKMCYSAFWSLRSVCFARLPCP